MKELTELADSYVWEMVRRETAEVKALGLELLFLDGHGRIVTDYQFIE